MRLTVELDGSYLLDALGFVLQWRRYERSYLACFHGLQRIDWLVFAYLDAFTHQSVPLRVIRTSSGACSLLGLDSPLHWPELGCGVPLACARVIVVSNKGGPEPSVSLQEKHLRLVAIKFHLGARLNAWAWLVRYRARITASLCAMGKALRVSGLYVSRRLSRHGISSTRLGCHHWCGVPVVGISSEVSAGLRPHRSHRHR